MPIILRIWRDGMFQRCACFTIDAWVHAVCVADRIE